MFKILQTKHLLLEKNFFADILIAKELRAMNEILIEGKRLRLRRANITDLGYIMALQFAPENLKFIVPFDEDYHRAIMDSDGSEKLDVIIE